MSNESFYFLEKDYVNVFSQSCHTALGYIGLFTNTFIIFVISKELHEQKLIGLLAVGDLFHCLREILDSSNRLVAMAQTAEGKLWYHNEKVPRILCLLKLSSHVDFIFMGFQQPATLALALERCIAVFAPVSYNNSWSKGMERKFYRCFYAYVAFVIGMNYLNSLVLYPYGPVNIKCTSLAVFNVFGAEFSYSNNEKWIFSLPAAILTVAAVMKGKSTLAGISGDADIQRRLTRTAVMIVLTNTVLVICPTLARLIPGQSPYQLSLYYSLVVSNSVVNLPVLLFINGKFREKSKAVLGWMGNNSPLSVGKASRGTTGTQYA